MPRQRPRLHQQRRQPVDDPDAQVAAHSTDGDGEQAAEQARSRPAGSTSARNSSRRDRRDQQDAEQVEEQRKAPADPGRHASAGTSRISALRSSAGRPWSIR